MVYLASPHTSASSGFRLQHPGRLFGRRLDGQSLASANASGVGTVEHPVEAPVTAWIADDPGDRAFVRPSGTEPNLKFCLPPVAELGDIRAARRASATDIGRPTGELHTLLGSREPVSV
jgi:hypothetical protein